MQIDETRLFAVIGERIKGKRESLRPRVTQADLAKFLGVKRTSVTNIESGNQRAPLPLIYSICSQLKIEICDLLPPAKEVIAASSSHSEKRKLLSSPFSDEDKERVEKQVRDFERRLHSKVLR